MNRTTVADDEYEYRDDHGPGHVCAGDYRCPYLVDHVFDLIYDDRAQENG